MLENLRFVCVIILNIIYIYELLFIIYNKCQSRIFARTISQPNIYPDLLISDYSQRITFRLVSQRYPLTLRSITTSRKHRNFNFCRSVNLTIPMRRNRGLRNKIFTASPDANTSTENFTPRECVAFVIINLEGLT